MRNKEEQKWKELQGRLLHIRIGEVTTFGNDIKVEAEILEFNEYISFEIEIDKE